jgi:hypothetical protein
VRENESKNHLLLLLLLLLPRNPMVHSSEPSLRLMPTLDSSVRTRWATREQPKTTHCFREM